MLVDNTVN